MITRMKIFLMVGCAVVAGATFAAGILQAGSHTAAYAPPADPFPIRGDFSVSDAQAFNDYALYNLGASFDGIPLSAISRRKDEPQTDSLVMANYVNFFYGDCLANDPNVLGTAYAEGRCSPPVQVQVWPACERHPALWSETAAAMFGERETMTVRGVPAYLYHDETMLDIQTGNVTVVIFGGGRNQVLRAADALIPVNVKAAFASSGVVAPMLPPPVDGVLNGSAPC